MRRPRFRVWAALIAACLAGPAGCKTDKKAPPQASPQDARPADLSGKKVLMVIASRYFQDTEFEESARILRQAKAVVVVASSTTEACTGMLGGTVEPDVLLSDVKDVGEYAAVIFVGGGGAEEFFDDPHAHRIAQAAAAAGKPVAAICIAPTILANAGLLKGKKATAWFSGEQKRHLEAQGAQYVKAPVVRDGNIITATGPKSAQAFAEAVCKALAGK